MGSMEEKRWAAVRGREKSAEGTFVYAVKTTGVYCRPGCPSRMPRREHVLFFADGQAAEASGFRACRRCRAQPAMPAGTDAIARACRLIEEAEQPLSLTALAEAAALSPSHFHRLFKRIMGVTPRAYGAMRRVNRAQESLANGTSVTETVYAAGYGSSSRFYDGATEALGMKPNEYRKGGAGMSIRMAVVPSYLGHVLVAATERGLCAITLGDDPETLRNGLQQRFPKALLVDRDVDFDACVRAVVALLEAPREKCSLPLDIQGTAFQRRVWEALQRIPAGTTMTYGELAASIGMPGAVRAVGQACGANPVAVIVPCHRVVQRGGDLGGYRWGVQRKRALLDRERP